ncbi:hypothetical protein SDC9_99363 [bioreactor metagenome]|uniref:DUF3196 domain-containing protein n=1 Tax=bioreactor metagenome TaxID=1076179 RepID=A0A645AP33_9ZZZZ|nr:hypothetical protein [Erysipelotrichaceae bacterium]
MANYYEQLISRIYEAIQAQNFQMAANLIDEELRMPYIPQAVEKQLNDIKDNLPKPEKILKVISDPDDLAALLNGTSEQQVLAVDYLGSLNLRSYMDLVQSYLLTEHPMIIKCFLISTLIKQQIANELEIIKDGIAYRFIPAMLEEPTATEGYQKAEAILTAWLGNDDPTLLNMCLDVLYQTAFLKLPEAYEYDEGDTLANSVIWYVLRAMQDESRWQQFAAQHEIRENYLMDINL